MTKLGMMTSMDSTLVGPVADALTELSETDRSILAMTFVEELNSTQIASRLGMKPSAVRMRRQRLLARLAENDRLRSIFGGDDDELDDIFEDAASFDYPDLVGM